MKFDLVVAIFLNLVANDYKSHVIVNGLVTFWLIFTSELNWKKVYDNFSQERPIETTIKGYHDSIWYIKI